MYTLYHIDRNRDQFVQAGRFATRSAASAHREQLLANVGRGGSVAMYGPTGAFINAADGRQK